MRLSLVSSGIGLPAPLPFRGFISHTNFRLAGTLGLNVTAYTSTELTAIIIQVLIAFLVIRRSYAMTQGVPYSVARLVGFPALILVLWGFSELESILLTPWALPYLIALDSVILVITTFAITSVAEGMTRVAPGLSGTFSYRIGFSLAALFVGAFVLRIGIAIALFPSALEFGSPPGGYPPIQQQVVLGTIDALFSVSVGLLMGRSLGISRKVRAARASNAGSGTR